MIEYAPESATLDFKKEQYVKEKFPSLIKDIMAMANVPLEGKRYIIIGVKEKPEGEKEYHSLIKDEAIDQATYQQVIQENVTPYIEFSYYIHEFEGNYFGIFEIEAPADPPHMMDKDYKGQLKKGDCYIRKGTQQGKMTRRDLDKILEFKSKTYVNNKIDVGFDGSLKKTLVVSGAKELNFPSKNKEKEIKKILDKRASAAEKRKNNIQLSPPDLLNPNFGQRVSLEEQSADRLEAILRNINKEYREHNWHYISEKVSERINLTIRNEGEEYLEDANIVLIIPSEKISVMKKIHEEPPEGISIAEIKDFSSIMYYPTVTYRDGNYIVEYDIGEVRHRQKKTIFYEELRVFFPSESINKVYEWSYAIYAKNLPQPIEGKLKVEVVE